MCLRAPDVGVSDYRSLISGVRQSMQPRCAVCKRQRRSIEDFQKPASETSAENRVTQIRVVTAESTAVPAGQHPDTQPAFRSMCSVNKNHFLSAELLCTTTTASGRVNGNYGMVSREVRRPRPHRSINLLPSASLVIHANCHVELHASSIFPLNRQ